MVLPGLRVKLEWSRHVLVVRTDSAHRRYDLHKAGSCDPSSYLCDY